MNRILNTLFVLLLCFLFFACKKKYPDGPFISLKSKEERIANTWIPLQVIRNGVDITTNYTSIAYSETYDKDGSYLFNSTAIAGKGQWEFKNDDAFVKRTKVSGQSEQELEILRLKEKSFWYKYTDGKDQYEFHLISDE